MKNILLADDHTIVRMGVKALLQKNLHQYVIDEAEKENAIEVLVKQNRYELILLDINMPGSDFVRLMHWLVTVTPDSRILVFSMHDESIYGLRCLQLGAKGFLHKSASDNEIVAAINRVLEDKKYISPELAELLSGNNAAENNGNPLLKLSVREMEIMMLLNSGKTITEISNTLHIQYSTASTFKRRVFEKLNIKNMHSLYKLVQSYNIDL